MFTNTRGAVTLLCCANLSRSGKGNSSQWSNKRFEVWWPNPCLNNIPWYRMCLRFYSALLDVTSCAITMFTFEFMSTFRNSIVFVHDLTVHCNGLFCVNLLWLCSTTGVEKFKRRGKYLCKSLYVWASAWDPVFYGKSRSCLKIFGHTSKSMVQCHQRVYHKFSGGF